MPYKSLSEFLRDWAQQRRQLSEAEIRASGLRDEHQQLLLRQDRPGIEAAIAEEKRAGEAATALPRDIAGSWTHP